MNPGRYNEVIYEEAMALLYQEWEFKTCAYPDGSHYGTADSNQCRKGVETELTDILDQVYANKNIKPNSKDVERYVETIKAVKEKYGEAGVAQLADMYSTFLPMDPDRKTTSMNEEEIKILQKPETERKLMEGYEDPTKLQGGKGAMFEAKNYPDDLMEMAIDGMPKSMVGGFKGIGKPAGIAYQGVDENGDPINGGGGNDVRARAVLKQWFKQDGKCAYTGLPLTLDYADLEHVKPHGIFKAKAERPENWVWTRRSVNQMKAESTMDDFLNKTSFGGQKGGVKGIKDIKAYNENIAAKAAKGTEKQRLRELSKDPKTIEEYMKNRNAIIDAFGKGGNERYLTLALGQRAVAGDKGQTLWDEVTRKGERNQVKGLTNTKGTYKVRDHEGKKETFAHWFNKNYADMTPAEQRKIKEIWAFTKEELVEGNNPYGTTGAAFGTRVSELINEAFG